MAKFTRKGKDGTPGISTASLPDIVFMLLFFFMVSTAMREVNLKVKVSVPSATEVTRLENKSLVSYIYVGAPVKAYEKILGDEPRIQVNDKFVNLNEISGFIDAERRKLTEYEARKMTISIKSDKETQMGIITDIKEELKKAKALKINYSTRREVNE
jgi:biopolymer transport protein ExbD